MKSKPKEIKEGLDYVDRVLAKVPGLNSVLGLTKPALNFDPRTIYHGYQLPEDMLRENGQPKAVYASNKIRTTKYTPLSFVPKNLIHQIKDVANIFFIFVAVISSFRVFGATVPGLGAVPIICIIVITAIRDAIEDHRRFSLDKVFNNEITYVLSGVKNPNIGDMKVGPWRKFKKACTRGMSAIARVFTRKKKVRDLSTMDRARMSTDTAFRTSTNQRFSMSQTSLGQRLSLDRTGRPSMDLRDEREFGRYSTEATRVTTGLSPLHVDSTGVKFKAEYWKNVHVGDVIKVYDGESVPADIIVISSSEPDGSCFIETRNLDGETNLKPRIACPSTKNLKTSRKLADAHFFADVEGANPDLSRFGWALNYNGRSDALGPVTFIPRGATVRNTKYVIGFVVYTGEESKIILNAGETPTKRSRMSRDLNFYIYISFLFLIILAIIGTIVQRVKFAEPTNSRQFFEFGLVAEPISLNAFVNFWASILMLQTMIPISLYISIEIVKTIQSWFIYSDVHLFDPVLNEPCIPKTWNICDDLGSIEFVFSDKTGTLTQNSMVFRKCSVNGKSYGVAFTEATAGAIMRNGGNLDVEKAKAEQEIHRTREEMVEQMQQHFQNPFVTADEVQLVSADVYRELPESPVLQEFFRCLALCNTVVSEQLESGVVKHKAESPDEAALVTAASGVGFTAMPSPKGVKIINVCGKNERYQVLQTLLFTSDRKRMSVLVRSSSGETFVYTKGADSIIRDLLNRESGPLLEKTWEDLNAYADEGLRTLLVAYRKVDSVWADDWRKRYDRAQLSPNRDELTAQLCSELETGLSLLGGTGIEDQLQEGVPDTISKLGQAGIKIWVLTGDKPETAISIGYSSYLLEVGMKLLHVNSPEQISEYLTSEFNLTGSEEEIRKAAADHRPASGNHALIIDGATLDQVLKTPELIPLFALLGKQCKAVICCRVSPAQKAAVVDVMKNVFDVMALAVGDGANDVSMIQKADIGVGIVGVEGRQAAMSSDFSIGQFRFLQRLILVHGHWNYIRCAYTIGILLYKNFVFTMAIFFNGIFNQFDNSYMADYSLIVLYNSVFTSLPVISLGLFYQDIPAHTMLQHPALYAKGILRTAWTRTKYYEWVIEGLFQAAVIYFLSYCNFFGGQFVNMRGRPANYLQAFGVYIICASCLAVNIEVLLISKFWDIITVIVTIISCIFPFAWVCIYTSFISSQFFYGSIHIVFSSLPFWACTLLTTWLALVPRIMYQSIQSVVFPSPIDLAREEDKRQRKHHKHQRYDEEEKMTAASVENPDIGKP